MIKIRQICVKKFFYFCKILKNFEIRDFKNKIRELFFIHKENMFTIEIEEGCKAPYKPNLQNLVNSFETITISKNIFINNIEKQ